MYELLLLTLRSHADVTCLPLICLDKRWHNQSEYFYMFKEIKFHLVGVSMVTRVEEELRH